MPFIWTVQFIPQFAMLVLAICAAEAANPGNGRFKYIKRPVSKYPHHDEDPADAEQRGEGDETAMPSADGAEGGEVPPPDNSQPPPDAQPPPEGEQPPPEQRPSQEEANQVPSQENVADVIISMLISFHYILKYFLNMHQLIKSAK